MTHTWHDISYGEDNLENLNCVIEIPRGSKAKYEIVKETGMLKLDRVLASPMGYPQNYGFIPQTYCDDGDALDALVLTQVELQPLSLLEIKPLGVMHMIDGGEADDKLIAVATNDPQFKHLQELEDLPQQVLDEILIFFQDYKKLENKKVEISGFSNRAKAEEIIKQSIIDYKEKFK